MPHQKSTLLIVSSAKGHDVRIWFDVSTMLLHNPHIGEGTWMFRFCNSSAEGIRPCFARHIKLTTFFGAEFNHQNSPSLIWCDALSSRHRSFATLKIPSTTKSDLHVIPSSSGYRISFASIFNFQSPLFTLSMPDQTPLTRRFEKQYQGRFVWQWIPLMIWAQRDCGRDLNAHHHFANRARFRFLKEPKPAPPTSFGAFILSQVTQCTVALPDPPLQRNYLWIFSNSSITPIGAANKER